MNCRCSWFINRIIWFASIINPLSHNWSWSHRDFCCSLFKNHILPVLVENLNLFIHSLYLIFAIISHLTSWHFRLFVTLTALLCVRIYWILIFTTKFLLHFYNLSAFWIIIKYYTIGSIYFTWWLWDMVWLKKLSWIKSTEFFQYIWFINRIIWFASIINPLSHNWSWSHRDFCCSLFKNNILLFLVENLNLFIHCLYLIFGIISHLTNGIFACLSPVTALICVRVTSTHFRLFLDILLCIKV